MKKKTSRIKWSNIFKFIVLICSVAIVVNDIYMLVIYPFIHDATTGLTLYGFLTGVLAMFVAFITFDELYEDYHEKNVSTVQGKHVYKHL